MDTWLRSRLHCYTLSPVSWGKTCTCPISAYLDGCWKRGRRMQCRSQRGRRRGGWGAGPEWVFLGWSRLACLAHDLPGPSVSSHARLGGSFVGAHLQADDILSLLHLVIREVSAVLLSFPAEFSGTVTILMHQYKRMWLWEALAKTPSRFFSTTNLLEEPVGVPLKHPILLGDCDATNGHQCPLHRSKILCWRQQKAKG